MAEGETPKPEGEEKPAPATPTFVPSDDFKQYQESMKGTLTGIQDALSQITKSLGSRPAEAPKPTSKVTDEEIDTAIRTGENSATVLRRMMDEKATELRIAHIDPLRTGGLAAISEVVREQAKPLMPHYDRFKKEIDVYIESMPVDMRTSPAVYKMAHDAVVGAHMGELVSEAKEQAIRAASDPKPEGKPNERSGRTAGQGGTPTPEDLWGREASEALVGVGRSPDDHAKRLGYKNWEDYYEKAIKEPA